MKISSGGLCEGTTLFVPRHFEEGRSGIVIPGAVYGALSTAFYGGMLVSLTFVGLGYAGLAYLDGYHSNLLSPDLRASLSILLPIIVLGFLVQYSLSALKGIVVFKYDVWINSYAREFLPLALALILLAGPEWGMTLAWIHLVTYTVLALSSLIAMSRHFSWRGILVWKGWDKRFLAFCLPLGANDLLLFLVQELDMLMLVILGAVEGFELAFYGVAASIAFGFRMLRLNFMKVFQPLASRLTAQGDMRELEHVFHTTWRWSLYAILPFAGVLLLAPETLLAIYHPDYASYASCLLLLAVGPLVNGIFGLNTALLLASQRTGLHLANNLVTVVVNAGLNLALIPRFGVYGAAAATATSMVCVQALTALQVRRLRMPLFSLRAAAGPLSAFGAALLVFLPMRIHLAPGDWEQGLSAAGFLVVFAVIARYRNAPEATPASRPGLAIKERVSE